jgi:hypothetical protein
LRAATRKKLLGERLSQKEFMSATLEGRQEEAVRPDARKPQQPSPLTYWNVSM